MGHDTRRQGMVQPLGDKEGRDVVQSLAVFLAHLASASVAPCGGQSTKFDSLKPPDISVRDYSIALLDGLECSPECFMMAFIYIDRFMCASGGCRVTFSNVHRMVLTAVVIAAKVQDDEIYLNDHCAAVGGISCTELNSLEAFFLSSINWRVQVSQREFSKFIELLRLRDGCTRTGSTYKPLIALAQEAKPYVPRPAEIDSASFKVAEDLELADHNVRSHCFRSDGRRRRHRCCATRSTGH